MCSDSLREPSAMGDPRHRATRARSAETDDQNRNAGVYAPSGCTTRRKSGLRGEPAGTGACPSGGRRMFLAVGRMAAMGATEGMSCWLAMRRDAILGHCGEASTFVPDGGGTAKGRTGMGRMGRSWLSRCRLGLRLRLSMGAGSTSSRRDSGLWLRMGGVGGTATSDSPPQRGRRLGSPRKGPPERRGGSRFV
jgi:hypothetical protein